ncbi:hypothetical protein Y032_0013g2048 [Ancylostoma ceylanicum]|uniref:DUF4781 domain-containing protein n=1 Tax=Ancylostoma ceylanicum TaxID=53326 RepID=A0A016VAJ6_9BILA|nr:hypothetical protein Y032_0013g2048 [Ancylostoma ceylanicum]
MRVRSFKVNKIKYDKEWEYESTEKWMNESWDELTAFCENTLVDYQRYSVEDSTYLEEQIATFVFGITAERVVRALRNNNLLRAYDNPERRFVTEARRKMLEIAGGQVVDMQVVPIYLLHIEDEDEEKTPSSQSCVFRVRSKNGRWKFIDRRLRTYNSFDDYLGNNKEPPCMMCYPADGFLRVQEENRDTNGNSFTTSEVHFGEPPSCKPSVRVTNNLVGLSTATATVAATIAMFTAAAPAFTSIAATKPEYSLIRQVSTLAEKARCSERVFTFATAITTLVICKEFPKYLRMAVCQNHQLTFSASAVVNFIVRGMTAVNASDLATMIYQFASELANLSTEVSALDVLNLVVIAHNMFSCWISPKSAKVMLEQARAQIKAENRTSSCESGDSKRNDELGSKMTSNNEEINQLHNDTLTKHNEFIEDICKGSMASLLLSRGTRKAYQKLVKNQQQDQETVTETDQNDRIIRAVAKMNADGVFRPISATKCGICLENGEILDLPINKQLETHPETIEQLIRTYAGRIRGKIDVANDLEQIMRVTRQFDSGQITEEAYLKLINDELQKYQMITAAEIAEVHKHITRRMKNTSYQQKKMFENMRPSVAYRMRTVLKGASKGDIEAAMKIAESLNMASSPFDIATCIAVVQLHFNKEMKKFKLKHAEISGKSDMGSKEKQVAIDKLYEEHFGLSKDDLELVNSSRISNKAKDKFLAERLAHGIANNNQRRAALVGYIRKRMEDIRKYAEKENLFHSDLLSLYYHVEKYRVEIVKGETNTQPQPSGNHSTQENGEEIFFQDMSKAIFTKKNFWSILLSQDAHTKSRIWVTNKEFKGQAKASNVSVPYENLLDNPSLYFPGEFVQSHFQKYGLA